MFDFLMYPFMQRAMLAGLALGLVLAFLGVFVILKRISFFGDGIAHASLAGIALGIIAGTQPFVSAIIYGIMFALVVFFLEKKTTLSGDVLIAILFTASMSVGILIINSLPGYQPDLSTFLFGNILAIQRSDLFIMLLCSAAICIFLLKYYKQLTFTLLDTDGAYISGINTRALGIAFYIALAIAIVLGVKLLGIILVSSLLILPASTSKLVSSSLRSLLVATLVVSEITVLSGIILSYQFNLATGPAIVLTGTVLFFLTLGAKKLGWV